MRGGGAAPAVYSASEVTMMCSIAVCVADAERERRERVERDQHAHARIVGDASALRAAV